LHHHTQKDKIIISQRIDFPNLINSFVLQTNYNLKT
jgi:hypothetical protein